MKPLSQNIRVSLRSITESLTLPGEYVTGKMWHLCSAYHVFMYKKLGMNIIIQQFSRQVEKVIQEKMKKSQRS